MIFWRKQEDALRKAAQILQHRDIVNIPVESMSLPPSRALKEYLLETSLNAARRKNLRLAFREDELKTKSAEMQELLNAGKEERKKIRQEIEHQLEEACAKIKEYEKERIIIKASIADKDKQIALLRHDLIESGKTEKNIMKAHANLASPRNKDCTCSVCKIRAVLEEVSHRLKEAEHAIRLSGKSDVVSKKAAATRCTESKNS